MPASGRRGAAASLASNVDALPTYPDGSIQHLAVLDPPLVPLPIETPVVTAPVGFLQLVPFTREEQTVLAGRGKKALADGLRGCGTRLLDFDRD